MEEDMQEYMELYLKEAEELLQSLNSSLLEFEKNPGREDLVEEMARCSHTLKSSSASMGYNKIAELAHSMEDGLMKLKESGVEASDEVISLIFDCFDYLELSVDKVTNKEPEPDNSELMKRLELLKTVDIKPHESEARGVQLAEKPHTLRAVHAIKVDVEILDRLVDLVGELLITTMRFKSLNEQYKIKEFEKSIGQLSMMTADIQYAVTEARMIPVDQVFNRFPRMVRDLAKRENKLIEFSMEGSEIKLDRTVLDQIGEPLIHLLRNSIDHGIETPEQRKAAGKSETGKIQLKAWREKNAAIIEVIDDGAGFDAERIREVAIKKGVITKEQADMMSEKDIQELPFVAAFSTSEKVTDVSGRGVGLDVVRTKIEELNGSVKMDSEKGKGTKFSLELPLTLAIIKCLLVYVEKDRYALPVINILRIVDINKKDIEHIGGSEVFILDKESIPLVRLRDIFELRAQDDELLTVVIIKKGSEKIGVVVDEIIGLQELIIKSVSKTLKSTKGIAGATILGDGYPALVLDTGGLV